ncbi:hypothetical protein ACFL5O_04220 [Myxococcota bacterium]
MRTLPPLVCATDGDCPEPLLCEEGGDTSCVSNGSETSCSTDSTRYCTYSRQSCSANAECSADYECFTLRDGGEDCTDVGGSCASGEDCVESEPECRDREALRFCFRRQTQCSTDGDCPKGWTCARWVDDDAPTGWDMSSPWVCLPPGIVALSDRRARASHSTLSANGELKGQADLSPPTQGTNRSTSSARGDEASETNQPAQGGATGNRAPAAKKEGGCAVTPGPLREATWSVALLFGLGWDLGRGRRRRRSDFIS